MCGIVGVYANNEVAGDIYDSLLTLQHRGQDAAGIATSEGRKIHLKKDVGLVRDVFAPEEMKYLKGNLGIGHTRYSTVGGLGSEEAQPMMITVPYGIVMVHNGNLVNFPALKEKLQCEEQRLINTDNDIETIIHIFAIGLLKQKTGASLTAEHIFNAVAEVYRQAVGGYSVIGFIPGQGLFAFRDPNGIRPLLFGSRNKGETKEYIFASENVAMDLLGYKLERSLRPGEAVFIDSKKQVHEKIITQGEHTPCIFEYVYFARPDSVLDEISVYKARLRLGEILAQRILEKDPDFDAEVIVPVPDSSRTAALAMAQKMNLPYREGLVKNRYIGRTFIMPGQAGRKKSIRQKLNPNVLELKGKKVLLVDDSIVRGNTSRKIVELVRDAGAKKVYFASYSPPVISPDLYGIDIPTYRELIAAGRDIEAVRVAISADKIYYQTVEDMEEAVRGKKFPNQKFHSACFTGKYIVGDVSKEFLENYDRVRSCDKKEMDDEN